MKFLSRSTALPVMAALVLSAAGCVYVPYADYPPPPPLYHRHWDIPGYVPPAERRNLEEEPEPEPAPRTGATPPAPDRRRDPKPPEPPPAPAPMPTPEKKTTPASGGTDAKSSGSVPSATRTDKAGRAKSPFPPYGELDITGLPPGSLARDPVSGKIFRVP